MEILRIKDNQGKRKVVILRKITQLLRKITQDHLKKEGGNATEFDAVFRSQ